MYAFIFSKSDEASLNMYEEAVKTDLKPYCHLFEKESVYLENMDDDIEADIFIFCTKHASKSGIPSLSVHTQGNWSSADLGGKPNELGICPASILKWALQLLGKKAVKPYQVIQEATHHGPSLKKPSMFIEIGSTEKEWIDKKAAKIIIEVLLELTKGEPKIYPSIVGIGGLHHCPNFKTIQLESDYAVGHVCPKYNLENLNREQVLQAMEKAVPKAELVVVDWKGLGEHKDKIRDILQGIEWKKTKDLK